MFLLFLCNITILYNIVFGILIIVILNVTFLSKNTNRMCKNFNNLIISNNKLSYETLNKKHNNTIIILCISNINDNSDIPSNFK